MWSRLTCWLAAVLLISACSHGTLTRVVRTDGTAVVGELIAARPDAVVVKIADGTTVTIPRSVITAIESAPFGALPSRSASSNPPASTPPPASKGGGASTASPASTASGGKSTGATSAGASSASGAPTKVARERVAPSGTTLELSLSTPIGSDTSAIDDKVEAVLRAPLIVNGDALLDAGAVARGIVTEATPAAKANGRGRLAVRFDTIQLGPKSLPIQAAPVHWEAPGGARRAPPPEPHGLFHKIVTKTKKGLHIGDDANNPRGSAEVRFAAGTLVRIRLQQAAHIAP